MPRGKPGTGPHARKRLQNALSQPSDTYMRLPLSEEETRVLYKRIQHWLGDNFAQSESFALQNVAYRITEHVAATELGLPIKLPPHLYGVASRRRRKT